MSGWRTWSSDWDWSNRSLADWRDGDGLGLGAWAGAWGNGKSGRRGYSVGGTTVREGSRTWAVGGVGRHNLSGDGVVTTAMRLSLVVSSDASDEGSGNNSERELHLD